MPYAIHITDPAKFEADRKECAQAALAYPHHLDLPGIAVAGAQGAVSNLSGAAVNAAVPVLGGAGSATNALLDGLGLTTQDEIKIMAKCADKLTAIDHSAIVVDPNG